MDEISKHCSPAQSQVIACDQGRIGIAKGKRGRLFYNEYVEMGAVESCRVVTIDFRNDSGEDVSQNCQNVLDELFG